MPLCVCKDCESLTMRTSGSTNKMISAKKVLTKKKIVAAAKKRQNLSHKLRPSTSNNEKRCYISGKLFVTNDSISIWKIEDCNSIRVSTSGRTDKMISAKKVLTKKKIVAAAKKRQKLSHKLRPSTSNNEKRCYMCKKVFVTDGSISLWEIEDCQSITVSTFGSTSKMISV